MINIKLRKEHIEIIKLINPIKTQDGVEIQDKNLFYSSGVLENILLVLGEQDNFIPGSEKTFEGKQYPEELVDKCWQMYDYITTNLDEILTIYFYFAEEGVRPGLYKRKESMRGIWKYFPNTENE